MKSDRLIKELYKKQFQRVESEFKESKYRILDRVKIDIERKESHSNYYLVLAIIYLLIFTIPLISWKRGANNILGSTIEKFIYENELENRIITTYEIYRDDIGKILINR